MKILVWGLTYLKKSSYATFDEWSDRRKVDHQNS
jgi:hypothetical protein